MHSTTQTQPPRTYARLIGALFLVGFLTYGIGFTLVNSVIEAPDFLTTIPALQTTLILGAFLMLLNTVVDIGKGVLFFPIAERKGKRTALVYLAAITVQVVLLDLGVLFLLMLVPLSEFVAGAAGATGEGTALRIAPHAGECPRLRAWPRHPGVRGSVHDLVPVPDTDGAPAPRWLWGVVGYFDPHHWSGRRDLRDPCRACGCSIPPDSSKSPSAVWLIAEGFNSIVTLPGRGLG